MTLYSEQRFREEVQRASKSWGWLLALGIVMALAGIVALGSTVVATLATVTVLGAVLIVAGVVDIVSSLASRGWRGFGLALVTGVLAAVLGGLLIARPAIGAGVLTLLLALVLLTSGIARIIYAATERFSSWGWSLASGILAVVLGALVIAQFPTSAFWFLGLVVAIELLFRGATWIAVSLTLHRAGHEAAQPPPQPSAA